MAHEDRLGEELRRPLQHPAGMEEERLHANIIMTTPNSDVIYAMSLVDLGREQHAGLVKLPAGALQVVVLDFMAAPDSG